MASLSPYQIKLTCQNQTSDFLPNPKYPTPFRSVVSFSDISKPRKKATMVIVKSSNQNGETQTSFDMEVPVLSCSETIERLRSHREKQKRNNNNNNKSQEFAAMYSSITGGITTDTAAMVIPMDDHMVHRGHGVFDTAAIVDGHVYELDQHVDRIVKSAGKAKIALPFNQQHIKTILIKTISASKCRNGSLRYWLSAGPGDFNLTPSPQSRPALYAVVIQGRPIINPTGVEVITSSVPIKSPQFATVKSTNYLPNALSKMEAEEAGAFASVWVDGDGTVAEGPSMNVGFVTARGNELAMPCFDRILSGCTAKRVLTLAERLVGNGVIERVAVRDVSAVEGKEASEMMLLGSGVLVQPVTQWDDAIIGDGKAGPVTKALLDLLMEDMKSGPSSVRVPIPY